MEIEPPHIRDSAAVRVTFTAVDYLASVDFYSADLACSVQSSWTEDESCGTIFRLGGSAIEVLAPTPGCTRPAPGFALSVAVVDPDEFCRCLRSKGVTITAEPVDQPWGERRFSVTDPSGVVLNFYGVIDVPLHP